MLMPLSQQFPTPPFLFVMTIRVHLVNIPEVSRYSKIE